MQQQIGGIIHVSCFPLALAGRKPSFSTSTLPSHSGGPGNRWRDLWNIPRVEGASGEWRQTDKGLQTARFSEPPQHGNSQEDFPRKKIPYPTPPYTLHLLYSKVEESGFTASLTHSNPLAPRLPRVKRSRQSGFTLIHRFTARPEALAPFSRGW